MGVSKNILRNCAYTLTEIVIVMLVVAIIIAVTIKITTAKLDNIVAYTYDSPYSTLREVSRKILSEFNANDDKYFTSINLFDKMLANPAFAYDPKNCFVEYTDPYSNTKYCLNYYLESYCNYGNFDCNSHVGQYGITNELCNKKPISAYNLYKTQGKYSPNPIGVQDLFDKIIATAPITARPLFMSLGDANVNTTSICKFVWEGQELANSNWMGCGEVYSENYCTDGYKTLIISSESDDEEPEPEPEPGPDVTPEPEPPHCNAPSEPDQKRDYCRYGYQNFDIGTCDYSVKPSDWPPTCQEGYRWNNAEIDCKCIPEPRTLPRKGQNFCEMFVDNTNTKSNSSECSGDAIAANIKDFSNKTPDITLRNGMKIYNLRQDPKEINVLANNKQGQSYDGVPNTNSFGYTVYVDIDGKSGNSILWEDVYPFYITMSGMVIPGYDKDNPGVSGGDSKNHLMVSVEEENYASGKRKINWIKKSVSYKEGACSSGFIGAATPYCQGVTLESTCGLNNDSNVCTLKHIKPIKFF